MLALAHWLVRLITTAVALSLSISCYVSAKETVIYSVNAQTTHCAFEIYLNDFFIYRSSSDGSTTSGVSIGEYIKPQDNVLYVEVWDPALPEGQWQKDARCNFFIDAVDHINKIGTYDVTTLNFVPDINKSATQQDEFIHIEIPNAQLGSSTSAPQITYLAEKQRYALSRHFTPHKNYIQWSWINSADLNAQDPNTINALQQAYRQFWTALQAKDIKQLAVLYHEMVSDAAQAGGYDNDFYFNSMGFEDLFLDTELELQPLDFQHSVINLLANKKMIKYQPSPIQFCKKQDKQDCFTIPLSYRLNDKQFIITR